MTETTPTSCKYDDFSGLLHNFEDVYENYAGNPFTIQPGCKIPIWWKTNSTGPLHNDVRNGTLITLPNVYGNVEYALDAYRVMTPLVFVLMLLVIIACFTVFFVQYKRQSPVSTSVYTMLVSITVFNFLTITGSLVEHSYLYGKKSDLGLLPYDSCDALHKLEKASQICHAVSVWLTASMTIQKCICICIPFSAGHIVSGKATVMLITASVLLGAAPFIVQLFDSYFVPHPYTTLGQNGTISTFVTCHRKLASFISDPENFQKTMAWVTVSMSRLVPCIVILITSVIIIVKLRQHDNVIRKMSAVKTGPRTNEASQKTRVAVLVFVVAMIIFIVEISTTVLFILFIIQVYEDVDIMSTEGAQGAAFGIDIVLYISHVVVLMTYCLTPRTIRNFKQRLTEIRSTTRFSKAKLYSNNTSKTQFVSNGSTTINMDMLPRVMAPTKAHRNGSIPTASQNGTIATASKNDTTPTASKTDTIPTVSQTGTVPTVVISNGTLPNGII